MLPEGSEHLHLDISRDLVGLRVAVTGEIDAATAPRLVRTVSDEVVQGDELVLDLAGVHFVDSAGLAALIQLHNRQPAGHPMTLINTRTPVRRVLEVTGLLDYLNVDTTITHPANSSSS